MYIACNYCSLLMYLDYLCLFFFFKQKTAYEMRISDWSSDVCSSDLFFCCRWLTRFLAWKFVIISYRMRHENMYTNLTFCPTESFRQSVGEIGRASCRERVWQYV